MFGSKKFRTEVNSIVFLICVFFVFSFLLTGCSDFKQVIGLERIAPNEFCVNPGRALDVPPQLDVLPPPEPRANKTPTGGDGNETKLENNSSHEETSKTKIPPVDNVLSAPNSSDNQQSPAEKSVADHVKHSRKLP